MDWEERDASTISLFKHCIAGKFIKMNTIGNNPDSIHDPIKLRNEK